MQCGQVLRGRWAARRDGSLSSACWGCLACIAGPRECARTVGGMVWSCVVGHIVVGSEWCCGVLVGSMGILRACWCWVTILPSLRFPGSGSRGLCLSRCLTRLHSEAWPSCCLVPSLVDKWATRGSCGLGLRGVQRSYAQSSRLRLVIPRWAAWTGVRGGGGGIGLPAWGPSCPFDSRGPRLVVYGTSA